MPRRLAAVLSLIVFAVCLVAGMEAENPLATTLARALVAMAGTLIVGLVVGAMAQKMLDENVAALAARQAESGEDQNTSAGLENPPTKSVRNDR